MEKTVRIAGIGMNSNFVEDSPQSVKPQASSTFMLSKTDFDYKDLDNTFQSPKQVSATSVLSTTSSLGVIDLEKQSLFSDKDESISKRLQESIRESQNFVEEQCSLSLSRFRQRLNSVPLLNDSNINSVGEDCQGKVSDANQGVAQNKLNEIPRRTNTKSEYVFSLPDAYKSPPRLCFFDDVSSSSPPAFDSSFKCGNSAVLKLEADQKENRKEFGSLPVSPVNISVNSENTEEREKKFTEFVKNKCYSPDEISNVLRNKLKIDNGFDKFQNTIVGDNLTTNLSKGSPAMYINSKIPVLAAEKDTEKFKSNESLNEELSFQLNNKLNSLKIDQQLNSIVLNSDVRNVAADSTMFFNDTLEESTTSSIASINQIAEALRRKSLMAEPKLAIEHLLSIGKSKSKFTPLGSPFMLSAASSNANTFKTARSTISGSARGDITPRVTTGLVKTPSTLTCTANDFSVDSMTGKVRAKNATYDTTFISARKLLESMNSRTSSISTNTFHSSNDHPSQNHFTLVKTVSLLVITKENDRVNDVPEFWKLKPCAEISDRRETLYVGLKSSVNAAEAYRKEISELTQNSCFGKTNAITEPVRRISLNQNLTSINSAIFSDTFETDSSSDLINAGTLCVGTQVEIIIAIENPCLETLKYKMKLESIFANEQKNLSAVSVMLVSSYPDILLTPKMENEIKIVLTPLIVGKIDVVLKFISEEKKFMNIIRQIRVTGEKPKLKLQCPETPEINFDLLPESALKNVQLVLTNDGLSRLPVKFVVHEESNSATFSAKTVIEPLGSFECDVRVTTYELLDDSPSLQNLTGDLVIQLDTCEEASLGTLVVLKTLPLSAKVAKPSLLINDGAPLILNCSALSKSTTHFLNVKNTSAVPLDISVQTIETDRAEFTIDPQIFKLLPYNTKSLKIEFKPHTKQKRREVDLNFVINGTNKVFSTKVTGVLESGVPNSDPTSLKRSVDTCITPRSDSSSNSSIGADGPMELDCTHNSISWGSIPLHTKNIQSVTLRNRSALREKLLLSISDLSGTFKFIENEFYCRDLKLTLESRESRKISVVFMPFVADQAVNGRILIIRRRSLESSVGELQKRVIPLYGIGGKVKILLSSVFRDNENRLWITPDSDSFETKFTVENNGDSVAFVKIVSEDSDDSVNPEELILLPTESMEVNYTLHLNKDRLDSLYKQNPSKEVLLVNKINVYSGCESTRLRLKKLWTKYRDFENIQRIREKIELLMDMHSHSKVQVDSLSDSQSALNKIWYEGITEQVIGVLMPQQHLESACLDSTVVFKDLADHTTLP